MESFPYLLTTVYYLLNRVAGSEQWGSYELSVASSALSPALPGHQEISMLNYPGKFSLFLQEF